MAIQDAQEQEAFRSKLKGKSSTQGLIESARITSVLKGATKVVDPISRTGLVLSMGSTFLAKREC